MKRLICLALLLTVPALLEARVDRICKVSYKTRGSWSREHKMEVTFVTGAELNRATRSYRYSTFSEYALLWFDKDEVALLKLKEMLFRSGDEFTVEDFRNLFMFRGTANFTEVNSGKPREWKIRAKEFLRFIDPREE